MGVLHVEEVTRRRSCERSVVGHAKFEEVKRIRDQSLKALAITKFESVFSSMFARNLRKATIEALAKIDEPLIKEDQE